GLLALDHAAAKTPDVEKARMRADADAVRLGPARRLEHDERIAAVKAAGDIRRRDDLEHLGIAAHPPRAKTLAHVAIQVDHVHRVSPLESGVSLLLIWVVFAAECQLYAVALRVGFALDRHVVVVGATEICDEWLLDLI